MRPSALLEEWGQHLPPRRQTCSVLGLTGAILLCLRDCLIKKNAALSHFNCFLLTLLQVTSKIALKGNKPFPKVGVADEEQEREGIMFSFSFLYLCICFCICSPWGSF